MVLSVLRKIVILFLVVRPILGNAQLLNTLHGHEGPINAVTFIKNGEFLLSSSVDANSITLWNSDGIQVKTFNGCSNGLSQISISPDETRLLCITENNDILLKNISTGKSESSFDDYSGNAVAFSSDGRSIAIGDCKHVKILDLSTYKTKKTIPINFCGSMSFSPKGKYLALEKKEKVQLWEISNTKMSRTFASPHVTAFCFSPDERFLACSSVDDKLRIWDIPNNRLKTNLNLNSGVTSISYSPNGKFMAIGLLNSKVQIIDANNGNVIKSLEGHLSSVYSIAFSPDGKRLASSGKDKTVRIWDLSFIELPDPKLPPLLKCIENSISFIDANDNKILNSGEQAIIQFVIKNSGKGVAKGLRLEHFLGSNQDIEILPQPISSIEVGSEQIARIFLKAGKNLSTGTIKIIFIVTEPNGFDSDSIKLEFSTQSFQPPNLVIVDAVFSSEAGGKITANYPAAVEVLLQNKGLGQAEQVVVEVQLPENVINLDKNNKYSKSILKANESCAFKVQFIINTRYQSSEVPIKIIVKEKTGEYNGEYVLTSPLEKILTSTNLQIKGEEYTNKKSDISVSLRSKVDKNIPINNNNHYFNRFALIIGNEDYKRFQNDLKSEQNVSFARNDALIFKEYLIKTFGFIEKQVFLITDATRGQMSREIERLVELAKLNNDAEIFFYYAGHGLPDFETNQGYLIPVDVTASNIKDGISLKDLYSKLASSNASRILVFLDACFSGGGRGENGLLAARTVKVKPKGDIIDGNIVAFTATSAEEVSLPYTRESHGLFTYYLLSKFQDSKGNLTMEELKNYLEAELPKASLIENSMKQTPQVLVAPDLEDEWLQWKFIKE